MAVEAHFPRYTKIDSFKEDHQPSLHSPMMRWLLTEYLLKGVFFGALLFVALQKLDARATGIWALATFGGLLLSLVIAARRKLKEGFRATGRMPAFIVFLILESPILVYEGILVGTIIGALVVRRTGTGEWFAPMLGGGAVLGLLFWLVQQVRDRWFRLSASFAVGAALVGGILYWLPEFIEEPAVRVMFGVQLLLGIPVFYLLTFAGIAEETEVEIGAMCAAFGVGFWAITKDYFYQSAICFVVPLVLYFFYTTRVLPGLRVFKHVVRGIGFANVGRYRPALLAFRRALQLDPNNSLARQQLWALHRQMDLQQLSKDPQTLALVDVDLCLERATALLTQSGPDGEKLMEAHHLLDIVLAQRPSARPAVNYWRSVALTHARQFEQAAAELLQVIAPAGAVENEAYRENVLLPAWQLALVLHPEMNRRVGTPQLERPGRRMEAVAAVERKLADAPEDADAWTLKRILYSGLTEQNYVEASRGCQLLEKRLKEPASSFDFEKLDHFDHGYAQQLGLALVNDSARRSRGIEYLRMAARGMPEHGPGIFRQIALAYEKTDNTEEALRNYELGKSAARLVGPAKLDEENRKLYFATVKYLGEMARARDDLPAALENYQLYSEYERSGLETLRILAELYEKTGDAIGALRCVEKGLLYDSADKDLLARKERYYYSVTPDELRAHLDGLRAAFDVNYCLSKAKSLLDFKDGDTALIEWAEHLAELAQVVHPDSVTAKVLRARALRRRGEIEHAKQLLVEAREPRPERFANSAEEDSWYLSCRLLGEMYLYELARPDLAVPCFNDFRHSNKSGADTIYKLGQAYEQLGDTPRAMKCYENVTAFDGHPLAPDAREALYRLRG